MAGIDGQLTPYDATVNENFRKWIFQQNAGKHNKFTEEQLAWLRMIKDHIASSFHIGLDDLDYTPFDAQGGRGKMWEMFGTEMGTILEELNLTLAS